MTRNNARVLLIAAALVAPIGRATGQEAGAPADSLRRQIHTRLRAFYFSLAHTDWEALTADILAAKVVAHRAPPKPRMTATSSAGPAVCSPGSSRAIESATIVLNGDWAEVSVPRCQSSPTAADEFRLIHFDERWRFVSISLSPEPVIVSSDH